MKNIELHKGAVSLIIVIVLLAAAAIIILFAAQRTAVEHKINNNEYRSQQAFQAAEAGLEHGMEHLRANRDTMVDENGTVINPTPTEIQNQILANGSSYSVTYSNSFANIIKILSIGTSDDQQAIWTIEQLVSVVSTIFNLPSVPLLVKGNVELGGGGNIDNPLGVNTIIAGGSVDISGSAVTATSDADIYSNATVLDTDVSQNDPIWGKLSNDEFFKEFFSVPESTLKNLADYHLIGGGNYTSILNGVQGAIIWIEPKEGDTGLNISINAGTVIGSKEHPVIMVLNGDVRINGHADIYGLVFVIGGNNTEVDLNGTANIHGAFVSTSNVTTRGTLNITYDDIALNNLRKTMSEPGKIAGSWIDY